MFTAVRAAAAAVVAAVVTAVIAVSMLTAGRVSAATTGTASVAAPIPTQMVRAAAPEVPLASPVTTTATHRGSARPARHQLQRVLPRCRHTLILSKVQSLQQNRGGSPSS
jgi:hypothetical protein